MPISRIAPFLLYNGPMSAVEAVAAHGEVIRVRGKGVPHGRGGRGDLLVRIDIEFPKKLSKRAREIIDQLRTEGL